MPQRNTIEEFVRKSRLKHGDKYDYSKVEYVNNRTRVTIICPRHGEFKQTPHEHLDGCGCKVCAKESSIKKRTMTTEAFIKKAKEVHGNKYDYSKVNYVDCETKVCIICPEHGEFWQVPNCHAADRHGCPVCRNIRIGNSKRSNAYEFVKKSRLLYGDKYDYSKVEYVGNKTKVCIICPIHGEFWQKPNDHICGHECPLCGNTFRKSEETVLNALKEKYGEDKVEYQKKFEFLHSKTSYQTIDFYLPEYNIGIEYQGAQHFKPIEKFGGDETFKTLYERDERKFRKCTDNGIRMLYITFENPNTIPSDYFSQVLTSIDELFAEITTINQQYTNDIRRISDQTQVS